MKESHNWYVRRGKEVKGPFPAGLISRYILLGRIHDTDEVSHDRQEWQRISRVPELIPEVVRKLRANPDDEDLKQHLEAARRWADERRDLQGPGAVGERRHAEGDARSAHVHHEHVFAPTERVIRRDYLLLVLILLVVVAIPFLLPSGKKPEEPQCDAPAAPGVNWSNCRMEAHQYPNVDLAGAKLRNANLTAAVLRAANLQQADLAYANLTLANLRGANLQQALLKGATLKRSDLTNANLQGADLSYADLSEVNLEGAQLGGAKLDHAIWAEGVVCMPGSVGECILAKPVP